jgi:MFS family permease
MTKTTQRTSRRASTHRSPEGQDVALATVLGTLLVGFVVVAAREVGATLGIVDGGRGDSYQLFAVSLTGLVGAVFALAMGATRRIASTATNDDQRRRFFSTAYVLTYVISGAIALLVCLIRLGSSTVILRSLAAAFLGTAVAVASAYFGTMPEQRHP